jgi:adenylate kinase
MNRNNNGKAKHGWFKPLLQVFVSLAVIATVALPAQTIASDTYVVMIGAPGSGKSTMATYISQNKRVPIIEVGQLLRDAVTAASKPAGKPGSNRANANARRLENIEAAKAQLEAGGYILDGYPGSVDQAKFLDAILAETGIEPIVIFLDVPDEVALARMKSRARVDDVHGFGEKRLELFRKNVEPLLEFYKDGGLYTVDATKEISEVRAQVLKVLNVDREISLFYK